MELIFTTVRVVRIMAALLMISVNLFAQPNVNFAIDKTSGCSPLTVMFTNASSGFSADATFQWNFGNGATSTSSTVAKTVYITEKIFTVTLTVKDGGSSYAKSETIVVFKKPVADFSATPPRGCAPLPVDFISTATPGDGTLADYFWDFGDGTTNQGADVDHPSHTYTFAQKPTVRLTVTNSYGCYSTVEKSDIIQVLQPVQSSFDADLTTLCKVPGTTRFTNSSTGPGTLDYKWDFGDGEASTDKDPAPHVYAKKGLYSVKLLVTSSEGCADTLEKPDYINAANFSTNFNMPSTVCSQQALLFTDSSQGLPAASVWSFSDNNASLNGNPVQYTFNNPGNFTVSLTNTYGTCTETFTKNINVVPGSSLPGFLNDKDGGCVPPLTVQFKDSSSSAVKWHWDFGTGNAADTSSQQSPAFTFTGGERSYVVSLSSTNSNGCIATTSKTISLARPRVNIYYKSSSSQYGNYGCPGLTLTFAANPAPEIESYRWDFGDGGTSTDPEPVHSFDQPGSFTIKLYFTTKSGCIDSAIAENYVHTFKKPSIDFDVLGDRTVCGNSSIQFRDLTDSVTSWHWFFGDSTESYGQNPEHNYHRPGIFDVTLIATNQYCSDTVTKKGFIGATPPFPTITSVTNSCENNRGTVTFKQTSGGATTWLWNFGDGTTQAFNSDQETVSHTYNNNGTYEVFLTTSDGRCTTNDSISVSVFLKQNPLLTSDKTHFCGSDSLSLRVDNLELVQKDRTYYYYYSGQWQFADNTLAAPQFYNWMPPINVKISKLRPGVDSVRLIVFDAVYGCYDTSNFVPVTVSGPVAAISIANKNTCSGSETIFNDQSTGTGSIPITKWIWDYGDFHSDTTFVSGPVKHQYQIPSYYYPKLTVIDANGCSDYVSASADYIQINGPQADFYTTDTAVSPGSNVQFINNTNSWPYGNSSTSFRWDFGDGGSSTEENPIHAYANTGIYSVTLTALNTYTGCRDTIIKNKYVKVQTVFAAYTLNTSYISGKNCPPLVAKFADSSINALRVFWDFGDNSYSDNSSTPTHTYYKPGIYYAKLYAYGQRGSIDSSIHQIIVNGPYGTMQADRLRGCNPTPVVLTGQSGNTVDFTWDLGDGNVTQSTDSFTNHTYITSGIFIPRVILRDSAGCSATFELGDSIIVDDLSANILPGNRLACDSAVIPFETKISSLARDTLQLPLNFHWSFGTGNPRDTSVLENPSFQYSKLGKYQVALTVSTPFGCSATLTDSVLVARSPHVSATGPAEICEDGFASFIGTADTKDSLTWKWDFVNGNSSSIPKPETQFYKDSGLYNVSLVIKSIEGCTDTTFNPLMVHGKPLIQIIPAATDICLGQSVSFNATGGSVYSWRFDSTLNDTAISNPVAKPSSDKLYYLQVTNIYGCTDFDSAKVHVSLPFDITATRNTSICAGNTVQLEARGAVRYRWLIGTGLNNAEIANPLAKPDTTIQYVVVGYGSDQCFTDTAHVNITVFPVPTVNVGPDIQATVGSIIPLKAETSKDVTQINWNPTTFLDCSSCAEPKSKPRNSISYNVLVKNQYGCVASDSINVSISCPQSVVFIPNSFSPNNDGVNDILYPRGKGIKEIKYFRIFNRWGELVFERQNFAIDDRSFAWDGTARGKILPADVYVYTSEMVCENNESFKLNGNIMIIR